MQLSARCTIIDGLKALGVKFPDDIEILNPLRMKQDATEAILKRDRRIFYGQRKLFVGMLDHAISYHFGVDAEDSDVLGQLIQRELVKANTSLLRRLL